MLRFIALVALVIVGGSMLLFFAETLSDQPLTAILFDLPERDVSSWLDANGLLFSFVLVLVALVGLIAWAIDYQAHRNRLVRRRPITTRRN